ncbi:hypothetical protein LMIY3S_05666 [Labrys miyagiensis]
MTASTYRESAKIYVFPTRTRTAPTLNHGEVKPLAALNSNRLPTVEFGSGWYHDAAIQEAGETRKR